VTIKNPCLYCERHKKVSPDLSGETLLSTNRKLLTSDAKRASENFTVCLVELRHRDVKR